MMKDYQVTIWQRGGKYYGQIKELGILANAADLQSLWQTLESEVAAMRTRFAEAGIPHEMPPPLGKQQSAIDPEFPRFLVRLAAITTAALLFMIVASQQLRTAGKDVAQTFRQEIGISLRLNRIVASLENKSPEKREELHRNLRTLAQELRPYLDDLQPLFESPVTREKLPSGQAQKCR